MSKSKQKGTWAETKSVEYFGVNGFPFAERVALGGAKDKGDVKLCPGVISEVKNCATLKLPSWFSELYDEIGNSNAKHGFLTIKPPGIGGTRIGQWWAGMTVEHFSELHIEAGYPEIMADPVWLPGHRYKDALPGEIAKLSQRQDFGYVGIRPTGVDDLRFWYVMTQLEQIVRLLRLAGYGNEVLV